MSRDRDVEERVLTAIHDLYEEGGIPPTVREIQERANASSPSVVYYIVVKLAARGIVKHTPGTRRSVMPAVMSCPKKREILARNWSYKGHRGHLVFEYAPMHNVCPRCDGWMVTTDPDEPYCLQCGHREISPSQLSSV